MAISRLHLPLIEPEDVVRHLAQEERHWKEGRSAHALTTRWASENALPKPLRSVLETNPVFARAELIDAFLERQVNIGSAGRPSQTDLLAVVGLDKGLAVLAVEGKAGETFGPLVSEWLGNSQTKLARLNVLCRMLGISPNDAMALRYQLLHRTASAIIEAKRYRTEIAGMLVHSFSNDASGLSDFCAFFRILGCGNAVPGVLLGPINRDGVALYAGWVDDEAPKSATPLAYIDALRTYASNQAKRFDRVRAWCDARLG